MADEPLQTIPDSEEEEGGPVKTFLEHLEDLRWVLIKCVSALLLGMVACFAAANYIVEFLKWPLEQSSSGIRLETLGPVGGVTIIMKIGLYGGITIALPAIIYFIAEFVVPALKRHEKRYFKIAFSVGTLLFLAGMALCYFFIMEISLRGLVAFNRWLNLDATMWNSADYFSFVIMFMVGMGLSFEIPVLVLSLVRLGIISHETLVKSRMYIFVGNLVVCAFITPDTVSTIFMVVPVQILMEICILISRYWDKQKKIADAAELSASRQLESTS
ncbi:MAG TPA: twin-arginine translocase subunit TatC [Candidatus Kapabacteria bacterium]|jgi:sec-independent protein translocase protein TatC|nr:twin-arginine translocase subunit TatC [Candidatus Kapabacteria bacterium]